MRFFFCRWTFCNEINTTCTYFVKNIDMKTASLWKWKKKNEKHVIDFYWTECFPGGLLSLPRRCPLRRPREPVGHLRGRWKHQALLWYVKLGGRYGWCYCVASFDYRAPLQGCTMGNTMHCGEYNIFFIKNVSNIY